MFLTVLGDIRTDRVNVSARFLNGSGGERPSSAAPLTGICGDRGGSSGACRMGT